MIVPHPDQPAVKLWVPSMPSMIQRRPVVPGSSPTSSPRIASPGRSRSTAVTIARSVAKSISDTGVPSSFLTASSDSSRKNELDTRSAASASAIAASRSEARAGSGEPVVIVGSAGPARHPPAVFEEVDEHVVAERLVGRVKRPALIELGEAIDERREGARRVEHERVDPDLLAGAAHDL